MRNHAQLKPIIEKWLSDLNIDEAVEAMLAVGVPAGPINTIDRVVADPHIAGAREMFVEVDHPVVGRMKIAGNQIKFSETPVAIKTAAPLLGAQTLEIMTDFLGYSRQQFEDLKAEGVF